MSCFWHHLSAKPSPIPPVPPTMPILIWSFTRDSDINLTFYCLLLFFWTPPFPVPLLLLYLPPLSLLFLEEQEQDCGHRAHSYCYYYQYRKANRYAPDVVHVKPVHAVHAGNERQRQQYCRKISSAS